jgi:3-isopropylmalate dehydrogenase
MSAEKYIVVVPGDGIGREVTDAAVRIMEKAAKRQRLQLVYKHCLAGGAALDDCGCPLPKATIKQAKSAEAVLLGAVGGPKWDHVSPELRAEQAILGLRKELGLYANLRPVRIDKALAEVSPLKAEAVDGVDLLIVRELSGGIYYGEKQEAAVVDGMEQASDLEIYTAVEIVRIMRLAFQAAKLRRRQVTSVDKANVLASSRLWRKTALSLIGDYPDLQLKHLYIDNCAMQLVMNPRQFDVIVTGNLFGDILSDEAAVLAGSIGMLPSASIGEGAGLYEPIHGSAPDIAGKGIANPLGAILSAAMLFRHSLQCDAAARAIEKAVDHVLVEGYRTADIHKTGCTKVSTEEMAVLVEKRLD